MTMIRLILEIIYYNKDLQKTVMAFNGLVSREKK